MPTYSITPSAYPAKWPPQCPSPSHPKPPPYSLSTTSCSFPRVRSLSCSVILTDIFTHFLSFPFIPFHYFLYSPNETICLMAEYYSIIYIDHIFFIHSSFDGHRGFFHNLTIVVIAAKNIGVQVSCHFTTSISLR